MLWGMKANCRRLRCASRCLTRKRFSIRQESPGPSSVRRGETIFTRGDTCENVMHQTRRSNCHPFETGRSHGGDAGAGTSSGEGCLAGRRFDRFGHRYYAELVLLVGKRKCAAAARSGMRYPTGSSRTCCRNIRIEDLVDQLFNSSEAVGRAVLLARYGSRKSRRRWCESRRIPCRKWSARLDRG